jgi:hypothetical protein
LKTLSQETIFSNANFLAWSLSNIPLGSSTPALLNKRAHHACGQPHGIRTSFVLREDLESNLDLVSKFSPPLIIKLLATSAICLGGSVINDSGLYPRVWVGSALTIRMIMDGPLALEREIK